MAKFEGYERREAKILAALKEFGINSIDECKDICDAYGIDPYKIVEETQPICFVRRLPMQLPLSVSVCRHSVSPAPLPKTARSVSDTETWAKCFFPTRQSASASWQDTNPLQLLRVQ